MRIIAASYTFCNSSCYVGTQDVVIGGGVEVMSMVPIGASIKDGFEAGHGLTI